MKCEEAQELVTALVDKELSDPERSAVESHLRDCPRCQWAYEQEGALKREIRLAGENLRAPGSLRVRILSDRRVFPERVGSAQGWKDYVWPIQHIFRPALVVALLLIFTVPMVYWLNHRGQSIFLTALETYDMILRGDLPMTKAKNTQELKEQLIRAVDGKFAPMEYDLSSMKVRPVGGAVREVEGRKMLVTVYEGNGLSFTCFTFLGTEKDAPKNAAVFFDREKRMNFYAFSSGGVHAVLHREGDVICILVSKMPIDALLALARGKVQPS